MVRRDAGEPQRVELPVLGEPRGSLDLLPEGLLEALVRGGRDGAAALQGAVALGPGLEKEDGRQQVELPQHAENLAVGRNPPAAALPRSPLADELLDATEKPALVEEGHEPPRRVQEQRVQGDGPAPLLDDPAGLAAQTLEPGGDLAAVLDRGGEQKEVHPHGQVDHDLFPDDPSLLVAEVVGLVEDHEVEGQVAALVHGVVELVAQDFRGPHDHRGVRVLLRVAREDAHVHAFEAVAELDPLGVRQGLQGRGVPAAPPFPEHLLDGLLGDPGLARSRRGHDEAVAAADGVEGVELKGIRPEGRLLGPPDPGENVVEDGFGFGLEPRRVVWTGVPSPAPGRGGLAGAASVHDGR
ncbi:MAG: hypothetical protein A4E67_01539 [Syntrophaceae bacterium PtaB.Bin038]|nr:MAG: hypothetical protein A4E67_01539 [Syntrophaceae bacterium PtaB.Bin038]